MDHGQDQVEMEKRLGDLGLQVFFREAECDGGFPSKGEVGLTDGEQRWEFTLLLNMGQIRPGTTEYRLSAMLEDRVDPAEDSRVLVYAERVTETLGKMFRARNVSYFDSTGNAWIRAPGLFIRVEGKPAKPNPKPRLLNSKSLQLIFLLLKERQWCDEPYRHLAERSNLSVGTVSNVMKALVFKGFVAREEGARRLLNPKGCLALWEDGWHEILRPKLKARIYSGGPDPGLQKLLDRCGQEPAWLVGGELAASRIVGEVIPTHASIHVPPGSIDQCARGLRLLPNPAGNVTILETFGMENPWLSNPLEGTGVKANLVDPILIRAELLSSNDERVHALARQLFEQRVQTRW